MMVIFVSQCEKNALKKTRRVLDAFADRIGDNTWQTVITEDGLMTVKKMLKRTASKSTSVSCHWIRSRSRTEFLWVVGNKLKFNEQGVVPVNSTSNELKTDEHKMRIEKIYANTKKQHLDKHLFAVGYVAYCLVKRLIQNDEKFAIAVFVAGCLHDIGKLDPEFQAWLSLMINKENSLTDELPDDGQHIDKGKFTFENHARHNEISLLLYQFFDDEKYLGNAKLREYVEHVIYWHHAKPIRKKEYETFRDIYRCLEKYPDSYKLSDMLKSVGDILKSINIFSSEYQLDQSFQLKGLRIDNNERIIEDFRKIKLPTYKEYELTEVIDECYKLVKYNAQKNVARSCVITADRLVSMLSPDDLEQLIKNKTLHTLLDMTSHKNNDLCKEIQACLHGFEHNFSGSLQNKAQSEAAQKLRDVEDVAVLKGPAGCGKTKISLEWAALTDAKKIIWICPRVQICEGLFIDLASQEYLPNVKVEICTGEFKFVQKNGIKTETVFGEEFSGDVVITTIDQVINAIITHTNATSLVEFMNAHVIFDEFHEYIQMPAFNLLFAELVECKKLQGSNTNAILVSATPNDFFVTEFLQIDREDIISIESFNKSVYQVKFVNYDETKEDETNPLFQLQPQNSIVISNTAITAQRSFILNQAKEHAILFHSRFKKSDKLDLFDKIFDSFKQKGSRKYNLLRSGPIVQASLNITCDHMVTEFTLAENWLQRLGRLDRFGERTEVNQYVIAVPHTLAEGKGTGACARFLSKLNCLQSAKAWYQFIQDKLTEEPITINHLYKIYAEFYSIESCKKAVEQDMLAALKKSILVINNKVHDPICFPQKHKANKKEGKLKKSSLRDDSRYVQMAICKINKNGDLEFINSYACDDGKNTFTLSVDEINGYDSGGDKDLLSYMHQKHHKIFTVKKGKKITQEYKSFLLKNKAIDSEYPIYLSYTDNDLALTNDNSHPHAIYYAIGENERIIGAISINKLSNTICNEE